MDDGMHAQLCLTLCDSKDCVAHQTPLSMVFSQARNTGEYWRILENSGILWSGFPFPLPVDLPFPGIEPMSLVSPALAGGFFTTGATWETHAQQ